MICTGQIRKLLDESILIKVIVRSPNDIRRLLVQKGTTCWLRERRLRKFNSKDFMSDESGIEKEMIKNLVYKGNWIAFNQIELQMDLSVTESRL